MDTIIILAWEPQQIFLAGFQLSFLVVLCIILLLPPSQGWAERFTAPDPLLPAELLPRWRRIFCVPSRYVGGLLLTSFAAWVGSLPLLACYFHILTPVSTPANIVADSELPASARASPRLRGPLAQRGIPVFLYALGGGSNARVEPRPVRTADHESPEADLDRHKAGAFMARAKINFDFLAGGRAGGAEPEEWITRSPSPRPSPPGEGEALAAFVETDAPRCWRGF